MVVNTQSVIKSVLKFATEKNANFHVKTNFSVVTNVLDFVERNALSFAELNFASNMMKTPLKFYSEMSKMMMQNLYY